MRINRGIGSKANLVKESIMLTAANVKPAEPPHHKSAPMRFTAMKAKAMGKPAIIKINRLPSISSNANGHSKDVYLITQTVVLSVAPVPEVVVLRSSGRNCTLFS